MQNATSKKSYGDDINHVNLGVSGNYINGFIREGVSNLNNSACCDLHEIRKGFQEKDELLNESNKESQIPLQVIETYYFKNNSESPCLKVDKHHEFDPIPGSQNKATELTSISSVVQFVHDRNREKGYPFVGIGDVEVSRVSINLAPYKQHNISYLLQATLESEFKAHWATIIVLNQENLVGGEISLKQRYKDKRTTTFPDTGMFLSYDTAHFECSVSNIAPLDNNAARCLDMLIMHFRGK